MPMPMDACVVLVTCPSQEEACMLAKTLVDEHLIACANVVTGSHPVQSFYFWEGATQCDQEYLLVMKTLTNRLDELEARIKSLHSYTVPECIALPIIGGSKNYLDWVRESVS